MTCEHSGELLFIGTATTRAVEAAGLGDRVAYLGRGDRYPLSARAASATLS